MEAYTILKKKFFKPITMIITFSIFMGLVACGSDSSNTTTDTTIKKSLSFESDTSSTTPVLPFDEASTQTSESAALQTTTAQNITPQDTTTQVTTEPITTTNQNNITKSTTARMVWIPETGKKYHSKSSCGTMDPDNARQVTEDEAIDLGYEPCGRCY